MDDSTSPVAVVTGAASGIGLALAEVALGAGMRVVMADIDTANLDDSSKSLAPKAGHVLTQRCDVTEAQHLTELRDATIDAFGRVDYVFNNAGLGLARSVVASTDADWDLIMGVNLGGVIHGVRAFLPTMIEQGFGHINATSSLSGMTGDVDVSVYSASKYAVTALFESLWYELERDHPNLSCSLLCPGPVNTSLVANSDTALANISPTSAFGDQNPIITESLARGKDPLMVARAAFDGIEQERFWLLPHYDLAVEIMDGRAQAVRTGVPMPGADW